MEGITNYRENCRNFKKHIPWQAWMEKHSRVTTKAYADQLTIKYLFKKRPDVELFTLIQAMLVADATLRLYGAREVLRRIDSLKPKEVLILAAPQKVASWLDNNSATFLDTATELQKHLIIVIAFRDWYMHGEIPVNHEYWVLRRFRRNNIGSFSLSKIVEACLAVCLEWSSECW